MDGILGYELDATKLSTEEKAECKEITRRYKKYYPLISEGDYYRLSNPYEDLYLTAWEHVSEDRTRALLSVVLTDKESNAPQRYVKLKGLIPDKIYRIEGMDRSFSGQLLMNAGLPVPFRLGQYESIQYYLEAEE